MKITKRQLRSIISETMGKDFFSDREASPHDGSVQGDMSADDIIDAYYNAINELVHDEWAAAGVSPDENPAEVQYVVQALENLIADLKQGQF